MSSKWIVTFEGIAHKNATPNIRDYLLIQRKLENQFDRHVPLRIIIWTLKDKTTD